MKKLLSFLFTAVILTFIQGQTFAASIPKTISDSGINKGAVSVSVKDIKTGKIVYELNEKQPMMPASTLKILTLSAALDTLGENYEFKTQLYKNTNNELFFKLGADPFFSSRELRDMISIAKSKNIISPKAIYVDDYILDSNEWGEGWQWDDDLNPLMPKFSSYNIDGNLLTVIIAPTTVGSPAKIYTTKFYPTTFMNLVTTGTSSDKSSVELSRKNYISPDMVTAEGTVVSQTSKQIPVNHPKRYFFLRLDDAIKSEKFDYYGSYKQTKLPDKNVYLIAEKKHSMSEAVNHILKNSNNLVAESVFKIAGAKYINNTGSLNSSLKMLQAYCDKNGLDTKDIKVVDGSGVSKNNIITTDFMTNFLVKQAQNEKTYSRFTQYLPTAGEGTLKNRMLYFKDNLHAKTGTLADVSGITGYITTRNGKTYAFDIMINDPKSANGDKKLLEEYILRSIYANY